MAVAEKGPRIILPEVTERSLVIGLIASLGSVAAGDVQTRYLIQNQPMKFAAMEGLYKNSTQKGDWAVISTFDTKNHQTKSSIEVPYVLNILSYHKLSGTVKGQNAVNRELHATYDKKFGKDMNYYVPTKTLFWSFRIMAVSGGLFILLALVGLFFNRKKASTIMRQRWFLVILGLAMWLPFIVNTTGWFVTEFGRYRGSFTAYLQLRMRFRQRQRWAHCCSRISCTSRCLLA